MKYGSHFLIKGICNISKTIVDKYSSYMNSGLTIKKIVKPSFVVMTFLIVTLMGGTLTYGTISEDIGIVSAKIANEYIGRSVGGDIQTNVNFTDVKDDYWAHEAITRMGAIDVTKGYVLNGVRQFLPTADVSKEEAITFLMRAIGMEGQAKLAAQGINQANGETTIDVWSKGYLTIAQQLGLITAGELTDALNPDQTLLDPQVNFLRQSSVTREQVAQWLVEAINSQDPTLIGPLYKQQNVLTFNDFDQMGIAFIPYIEAVVEDEIMVGDGTDFNPKGNLTRAEMMQILSNMDTILYDAMALTEKSGYVGHIEVSLDADGQGDVLNHSLLVRQSDGSVDKLTKITDKKMNGVADVYDAVVYRQNQIHSLDELHEGDTIHYIVNELTHEVLYVQVVSSPVSYHVEGVLQPLNEVKDNKITVQNIYGNDQTYTMADTLYDEVRGTLLIDEKYVDIANAPITNQVKLTIKNQLVTEIQYGGILVVADEFSGMVIEHNTDFNYIRISDWDGNEVTKRYNEGQVEVEKENYYDKENQVGYFDQLFPYYGFDENDTSIDQIEAGDIVHVKLDSPNVHNIIANSAKTNYTVKFGKVIGSRYKGDDGYDLTIELDDDSIVSYLALKNVPVIEGDYNKTMADIEEGDLVRLLVNQAVVAPGTIRESVKEINIDPNGNIIESIYRGELGNINESQETIGMVNSYELIQTGWKNYLSSRTLDVSKDQVPYYYGDKRITLDYADKYLRSKDVDMYVATEKYFDKERVTKVTFRDSRDSVLDYSNVTLTNGYNEISTSNHDGSIAIDEGTIVVKNDKMISPANVMAPDYTQVVLNGNNQAAVIRVKPEPNNESISVMRGRVATINDYEDFTVQSHAVLNDMDWIYSPIERTYEIDYTTVIKDTESTLGIDEFIGYSDASKVDEVYTIIANGVHATHIIQGPYCLEGVRGEVFDINSDDLQLSLKDTLVYDTDTKQWNEFSRPNSYSLGQLYNESIIIKNNQVIDLDGIEIGDQLRIMSTTDLADELLNNDVRDFDAYIIFVE